MCVLSNTITQQLLKLWMLRSSKISIQFTRRCVSFGTFVSAHIFTMHTHTRTDDGNVSVWTRRSREEFSIFHCNFALGLLRARHIHTHTHVYVDMCIQTHTHTHATLAQGNAKVSKQTAAVRKKLFTQNPIPLSSAAATTTTTTKSAGKWIICNRN